MMIPLQPTQDLTKLDLQKIVWPPDGDNNFCSEFYAENLAQDAIAAHLAVSEQLQESSLTFGSEWETYPNSVWSPKVIKQGKICHVRGLVARSTNSNSATIATLPTGFRPEARLLFISWLFTNSYVPCRIDVLQDGRIQLIHPVISGSVFWLSLFPIWFMSN